MSLLLGGCVIIDGYNIITRRHGSCEYFSGGHKVIRQGEWRLRHNYGARCHDGWTSDDIKVSGGCIMVAHWQCRGF